MESLPECKYENFFCNGSIFPKRFKDYSWHHLTLLYMQISYCLQLTPLVSTVHKCTEFLGISQICGNLNNPRKHNYMQKFV